MKWFRPFFSQSGSTHVGRCQNGNRVIGQASAAECRIEGRRARVARIGQLYPEARTGGGMRIAVGPCAPDARTAAGE
eukprot:scaffold301_cov243-Pinguiococcus_pyrenoidosus.AAC.28